jgi:transposase-like protein
MEEVYAIRELAKILGVAWQTVVSWRAKKQIPVKAMTPEGTFIKSAIDPFIEIYKKTSPPNSLSNQSTQAMPAKKQKKKNYPVKIRKEAMRLIFEDKLTYKEVAAKIGCSINTIHSWRRQYKAGKSEAAVPKTRVQSKVSQRKKAVATPETSFDDFIRNYWNEGTRAVDVLLLPPEIGPKVAQYVNEALRYAYDQFQ